MTAWRIVKSIGTANSSGPANILRAGPPPGSMRRPRRSLPHRRMGRRLSKSIGANQLHHDRRDSSSPTTEQAVERRITGLGLRTHSSGATDPSETSAASESTRLIASLIADWTARSKR
jgi:hypothetical protein